MVLGRTTVEEGRLQALQSLDILDTPPEENFDRITRLAKAALKAPMALISLVDRERQWFKSRQGVSLSETQRSISFCSYAIEQDAPLIIPDASLDVRFAANPLVTGAPRIRSYAGAQLKTGEGYNLGTLCVLDTKPRCFSNEDVATLEDFAQLVMDGVELRLLATTDGLTGCSTRRAFLKSAQREFASAQRARRPTSCVVLDVDFFKIINDTYGHAIGDRVLRRLVAVCKAHIRASDYIGRLGGEEFAIALPNTTADVAFELGEHLRQRIEAETFFESSSPFNVTASLGVAEASEDTPNFAELLERADVALYRAKSQGRNRTIMSGSASAEADTATASSVDEKARSRRLLVATTTSSEVVPVVAVQGARRSVLPSRMEGLKTDSIRALFQPIENLRSGEIVGFEALARLDIAGDLIVPTAFFPSLKHEDLLALFYHMLGLGIAFLRSNASAEFYVTVNVETSLLLDDNFIKRLGSVLDKHRFASGKLIFELLEGDMVADVAHMNNVLNKIRALGILVALDDIGSGYSSLIVLRDIPIDVIKLDKSFALTLHERPDGLRFVHNVLSLARALDKRLIVEGVETLEIADAMRVLGVEFAQGFAIARPMRAAAVGPWLAERRPRISGRTPLTLLGAYAGHLAVVETCRVLMNQPLPITWKEESKDAHACAVGRYFDRNNTHDTACGLAHKRFHEVMALYASDTPRWMAAAESFRKALEQEIVATSPSSFQSVQSG